MEGHRRQHPPRLWFWKVYTKSGTYVTNVWLHGSKRDKERECARWRNMGEGNYVLSHFQCFPDHHRVRPAPGLVVEDGHQLIDQAFVLQPELFPPPILLRHPDVRQVAMQHEVVVDEDVEDRGRLVPELEPPEHHNDEQLPTNEVLYPPGLRPPLQGKRTFDGPDGTVEGNAKKSKAARVCSCWAWCC